MREKNKKLAIHIMEKYIDHVFVSVSLYIYIFVFKKKWFMCLNHNNSLYSHKIFYEKPRTVLSLPSASFGNA